MKYDFWNAIVLHGVYYVLTDELPDGVAGSEPWDVCGHCDLRETCKDNMDLLCELHDAEQNERYKRVGVVDYTPRDGWTLIKD